MTSTNTTRSNDKLRNNVKGDNATAETLPATAPTGAETPAAGADTSSEAGADGEPKKRGRGAIPTMPICIVYERQDGKTVAAVVNPTGERYEAVGRGKGSSMGALIDMGFVLSTLHLDPPGWVAANKAVPEGVKLFGYANITGFPLPKQD